RHRPAMRLEWALADQTARPYPDKRGELAVAQQIPSVFAGHADHARNGIEDAQQPLMRLSQPVLPTFALARASGRRRVVWVAAETIAIRRQRIARAEAEVAMIYREQQMVDGAG